MPSYTVDPTVVNCRVHVEGSQPERMPGVGVEPTRPCGPRILSPLRLPFRHPGHR